jgi:Ca2+ regulator and membrane fusion protein Fig1
LDLSLDTTHRARPLTLDRLGLVLAGCTSTAALIPQIYLLSLSYKHPPSSPSPVSTQVNPSVLESVVDNVGPNAVLRVNVGYFGICYSLNHGDYVCSRNIQSLAQRLNSEEDPLNLIWQAQKFKDEAVFSPFM